ncbi:hypothetical protein ACJMK2_041889 [Sinanodonta woodiana]|uniref:Delta-like protein n=1 Tax=Sinanodonta woodiana TaxID=1069815 RepID=A0ABD3W7H3_SINWO
MFWQGGVKVRINVSDVDSDDSQLVDYFEYDYRIENVGFNQTVATERKMEISGNRPIEQTRLSFGISVFCDQHYYGHDCSIKCVGQNGCDGHYSCDDKGKKVCRPGWSGPECTEQINEGEADCRVYIDRPELGASSWTGTYNCSTQQAVVPIALNLTTTDGNIAINGYITFGSTHTLITGTFAHVAKLLVVQTPSDLKYREMGLVYTSAELNLFLTTPRTFDGFIAFSGDTRIVCGAHFSRQDGD